MNSIMPPGSTDLLPPGIEPNADPSTGEDIGLPAEAFDPESDLPRDTVDQHFSSGLSFSSIIQEGLKLGLNKTGSELTGFLEKQYDNGIKYLATVSFGTQFPVGVADIGLDGGIAIDVADLLEITPEGQYGKVSVWTEFEGMVGRTFTSAGKASLIDRSGLSIAMDFIPVRVSQPFADDRASLSGGVTVAASLAGYSLDVSNTVDTDLDRTLSVELSREVNAFSVKAEFESTEDPLNLNPSFGAELDLIGFSSIRTDNNIVLTAGLEFTRIQNFAEVDRSYFEHPVSSPVDFVGTVLRVPKSQFWYTDGITGDLDSEVIHGTQDDDFIIGGGGNDKLFGLAGDDTIVSTNISGDAEFTEISGGDDDDLIIYDRYERFKAFGGNGNDTYLFSEDDLESQFNDVAETSIVIDDVGGFDNIVFYTDKLVAGFGSFEIAKTSETGVEISTPNGIFGLSSGFTIKIPNQLVPGHNIEVVSFARLIGETELEIYGVLRVDAKGGVLFGEQSGTSSADNLVGQNLSDRITAAAGDDIIKGLGGDDRLIAGSGNDLVVGGKGNDLIKGGKGEDILKGNGGADVIKAGGGADIARGGGGADILKGGGGADELSGGGGADLLRGNGGDDILRGNSGADVFQFRTNDRNDTILDFRRGQDKIEIQNGADSFEGLRIEQDGRDVLIGFGGTGQVRVVTDNAAAFNESDFIF